LIPKWGVGSVVRGLGVGCLGGGVWRRGQGSGGGMQGLWRRWSGAGRGFPKRARGHAFPPHASISPSHTLRPRPLRRRGTRSDPLLARLLPPSPSNRNLSPWPGRESRTHPGMGPPPRSDVLTALALHRAVPFRPRPADASLRRRGRPLLGSGPSATSVSALSALSAISGSVTSGAASAASAHASSVFGLDGEFEHAGSGARERAGKGAGAGGARAGGGWGGSPGGGAGPGAGRFGCNTPAGQQQLRDFESPRVAMWAAVPGSKISEELYPT
jgi:hypothetical protein